MEDRLLNQRSGVLHRYPAYESCNVDAIPLQHRLLIQSGEGVGVKVKLRYCKRCFPHG